MFSPSSRLTGFTHSIWVDFTFVGRVAVYTIYRVFDLYMQISVNSTTVRLKYDTFRGKVEGLMYISELESKNLAILNS